MWDLLSTWTVVLPLLPSDDVLQPSILEDCILQGMNEVCEELAAKSRVNALHGIVDNASVGAVLSLEQDIVETRFECRA